MYRVNNMVSPNIMTTYTKFLNSNPGKFGLVRGLLTPHAPPSCRRLPLN